MQEVVPENLGWALMMIQTVPCLVRAAVSGGEPDTTPDAAGCSATVQPSVGVAAGLPTPLDVAAGRTSQIQGQL
jgi:hypothetical protein